MAFLVDGTSHQETKGSWTKNTSTHDFTQGQAPMWVKDPTSCLALFFVYMWRVKNITVWGVDLNETEST